MLRPLLYASALTIILAAAPPTQAQTLYESARDAVAQGRLEKTRMLGFNVSRGAFSDVPTWGGVLLGLELGVGTFFDKEVIYALRPLYRGSNDDAFGKSYDSFDPALGGRDGKRNPRIIRTVLLKAPPGYAVGGITMRTGLGIDGLALEYHRINGLTLDSRDAYVSDWVGNKIGGSEGSFRSNGQPVVGIFGTQDERDVKSLGFVFIKPAPTIAQPAARKPAPPVAAVEPVPQPQAPQEKKKEVWLKVEDGLKVEPEGQGSVVPWVIAGVVLVQLLIVAVIVAVRQQTAVDPSPPTVIPATTDEEPKPRETPPPLVPLWPEPPKTQQLATRLGAALGMIGASTATFIVGPHLFPREPGEFSTNQMFLAGAFGGIGAAIGGAIGKLIDEMRK